MQSIERMSLAEKIAAELRRQILRGDLQPGDRLPAERVLATTYETNRNTLREAIRLLEMQGLLSVRHGSGATVKDYRTEGHITLLPHLLAEMGDPASLVRQIADLLVFRRLILAETGAMAARRASEADVEALRGCLDAIRECDRNDVHALIRLDLAFYKAIAEATGSDVVRWSFQLFGSIYEAAVDVAIALWVVPDDYERAMEAIVDAIRDGDPDLARDAIARHMRNGEQALAAITGEEL